MTAIHRDQIHRRFSQEIDVFQAAYQRSSVYRQLKRATELTAQEYGGRFLIELIQNAHDALPPTERNGRVLVVLNESDGEHGALYVANTGEPFSEESFSAICEFAHSSKRPGESIGNKGIGFRSVLQISDWPEIYSRRAAESGALECFDGYCFRFATPEDIAAHTGDAALTTAICDNVSRYSLPFPLDEQPPIVAECAALGFATVVRLPLRNAQAAQDAVAAFDGCIESDAPLHLFLGRVEQIAFERRRRDSTNRVTLSRSECPLSSSTSDVQLSRVTLGYESAGDQHAPAEYLVGAMVLSERAMRTVIDLSIAQGKLPDEWRRWSGEGRVSVGVTLDGSESSRLYNYLPMGETAESPLLGFLDAPFFAKIDRASLDPAVPLNSTLLSHGAILCLRMAETLSLVGEPAHGPMVARLLAWSEKDRPRLLAAVGSRDKFQDLPLIPVIGESGGRQRYASLKETFDWRPAGSATLLTAERLSRSIDVAFLDSRVGPASRARLAAARSSLVGADFTPALALVAEWTERLAGALVAEKAPLGDWDAFYADVSTTFALSPQLLQGRRIVLDDTLSLQPAGRSGDDPLGERVAPLVFLAPVRDRTEGEEDVAEGVDLVIPEALKPFVRYAHSELRWRARDGETSIRPFFVQHRLVRRFGKRELREMIRALLAIERDEAVYAAALEFAFRVVSLSPDVTDPKAADLRLRVPTRDGRWLPANDGVFSRDWGKSSAASLEQLVAVLGDVSAELRDYVADMIPSPAGWPFHISDVGAFGDFLAQIGVKDGLWPLWSEVSAEPRVGWSPQSVAHEAGLSAALGAIWAAHLTTFPARRQPFTYPSHRYRVDGEVCTLPGAEGYHEWPSAARLLYAQLVSSGIGRWDETSFWCAFAKVGGYPDEKKWPSPLLAFLTDAEWIPVSGSGAENDIEFRRPRDAWFAADESERLPEFLPSPLFEMRRMITRSAPTRGRLRDLMLARFWDNSADALHAVVTLGQVFVDGCVAEEAHGAFWSVYQQKWRDVLRSGAATRIPQMVQAAPLIVRRCGSLEPWSAGVDQGALVLMDGTSPLRAQLIDDTQSAMFSLEPYDALAAAGYAELGRVLGARTRLASEVQLTLRVDGKELLGYDSLPHLRETDLAAAGDLATLFIAVRASLTSHKARESALDRLQQVHVALVNEIVVTVHGLEQPAVSRPNVLADPSGQRPTLIITKGLAETAALSPLYAHPLAELAGLSAIASGIELTLRRAQEQLGASVAADGVGELPVEVLCYALHITPDRLREARALTNRSLRAAARLLLPVIALCLGDDWTDAWRERILGAKSLEELRSDLETIQAQLPAAPEELLDVCRSEGRLADVRDRLGLDFGDFNAALRHLGSGYRPIVDRPGQESAFHAYLARMHSFIDDEIRRRFWHVFAARNDLAAYIRARSREGLVLDEAWLERYRVPPEDAMRECLHQWLACQGDGRRDDVALEPIESVREANRVRCDALHPSLRDIVSAWCLKHGAEVPPSWRVENLTFRLDQAAYAEGWGDFTALQDNDVVEWLNAAGRWPLSMPVSADILALGLTMEDVSKRQLARDADAKRREHARRSIELDGSLVEVDTTDFQALAAALAPTLGKVAPQPIDRVATLEAAEGRDTRRGGGGARGVAARQAALSDAQRLGVGFIGELVVRELVRRQYPEFDVNECWKSGYKNAYLGRTDGDDALGYDFEVPGKRRLLLEVKASTGEDWQFALGESEVREAQRASADRTVRYRIVFVANVLDTNRRRVITLPNPFSAKGAEQLRMVGAGMRFRFEPVSPPT